MYASESAQLEKHFLEGKIISVEKHQRRPLF